MAAAGSVWGRGGARGSPEAVLATEEDDDVGERRQQQQQPPPPPQQRRRRRQLEEVLEPLPLEEIEARVERTRREFFNRRKILIKNLPSDVTNQDVHDMLRDYELKYCFVDKYKGTAFVTLLNGEQAEAAIEEFHQNILRDREIIVQLQPTDALLCIANLPQSYTQQQLEELVRPFGNLERCFLVYNEQSGHPKGYGFVEYMKKDSASRAKSDLLGKQLGTRTLYVHWTDVNQLTYDLIHSKCLCVEKLPHAYNDTEELRQIFSAICPPTFCQVAYGQDGQFKGFAIVEYESAEIAEMVQQQTDGLPVAGNHIRVSFCAPGPPGRSMLAALIAAQATALNRGKGLLPEPNVLQLLNNIGTSASLQLLLNPLLHGALGGQQGILGAAPAVSLLTNPVLSTALLQLALQSQNQTQQTSGILGESAISALQQNTLGLSNPSGPQPRKKMMGEPPPSVGCLSSDITQGNSLQSFLGQMSRERESPVMASSSHARHSPVSQPALQGLPSSILGSLISGLQKQTRADSGPGLSGVSLLGDPPRDFKIPHGPPLNMHGFRSSASTAGGSSKSTAFKQKSGEQSSTGSRLLPTTLTDSSLNSLGFRQDSFSFDYQQEVTPRMYPQSRERVSSAVGGFGYGRHKMPSSSSGLSDRSSTAPPAASYFSSSSSSYFTSGLQTGLQQSHLSKALRVSPGGSGAGGLGLGHSSPSSNNLLKTPIGGQKRGFSHLIPSPEPSPEGSYVGQHSQGLGGHYADSYLKRKRIF